MKPAASALSFELLKGKQGQNRRGGQINGEMDNGGNYKVSPALGLSSKPVPCDPGGQFGLQLSQQSLAGKKNKNKKKNLTPFQKFWLKEGADNYPGFFLNVRTE